MIKAILNIEGLLVLLLSIFMYFYHYHFSLMWFLILLFAPDISMLGYIVNSRIGATLYNIFHSYILPILCIILGMLFTNNITIMLGLVWTAHIGMDRVLGYGLKYNNSFKETHLQKLT
ncbi:hypothetical protein CN326_21655 [Bacillus sp. AFS018417]|uniref:DUF4260 domain-containing protein n=1 Tax=Bacillus sp. AFS018417 TaxID=2033491 RepID=UPI000BF8AF53|nr:DUF4260 domain-containing protein [Bacillus sp. AFS018417]PEZ01269.1 hypothetical protein CN326_21655 [Bacillus sp. AFS018417]